jgi:hypothetical protein
MEAARTAGANFYLVKPARQEMIIELATAMTGPS